MPTKPPICDFGWKAPDFLLPGVDGKTYALKNISGPKGAVVMFICNHCPFVRSILDKILRDAIDLLSLGVGVTAISSNDADAYPQDSYENMEKIAKDKDFPFPYLYDEDQEVARLYNAVCTPDFLDSTRRVSCNIEVDLMPLGGIQDPSV